MNKDNGQIICSIDGTKDKRAFEEIPFNRTIYDFILVKHKKTVGEEDKIN